MSQVEQPFLSPSHNVEYGGSSFLTKSNTDEEAKVVWKRGFPFIEFFVHILGVGTVVVLACLNMGKVPWVDFDINKETGRIRELKGWQLLAKVHDLIMVSSLSYIVFYHMRRLLIAKHGVPFGLLNASYQIGGFGMLCKKSWWSAFSKNWKFASLLLIVFVVSIVAGPASAILLIPSTGWVKLEQAFPAAKSSFYIKKSGDVLWPQVLNDSFPISRGPKECRKIDPIEFKTIGCPTSGYPDINQRWMTYIGMANMGGVRFGASFSGAQREAIISCAEKNCDDSSVVYSTVVTDLATTALGYYFGYSRRENFGNIRQVPVSRLRVSEHTTIKQPVVSVKCRADSWESRKPQDITFPDVDSAWTPEGERRRAPPYTISEDSAIWKEFGNTNDGFQWMKDTRINATSSLLGLATLSNPNPNATTDDNLTSMYVACSLDARWFASELSLSSQNWTISSNVTESLRGFRHSRDRLSYSEHGISTKPIDIQLDWASYLNSNATNPLNGPSYAPESAISSLLWVFTAYTFGQSTKTANLYAPSRTADDARRNFSNFNVSEKFVSSLLSLLLADGIARSLNTDFRLSYVYDKPAGSIVVELSAEDSVQPENMPEHQDEYKIDIKFDRYVYGWMLQGRTAFFALAALLLYATAACLHMVWLLVTVLHGRYYGGNCWEHVGDLVALAMNSSRSAKLDGTGAGVGKGTVWKHVVKVRSVNENNLEMCFLEDHEEIGKRVERGKKYY